MIVIVILKKTQNGVSSCLDIEADNESDDGVVKVPTLCA